MKIFMVVCCMCVIGFTTITTNAQEELPLATGEWPPYTSKHIEGYGLCTEIVSAIVQEMSMTPKYKFYPWKRAEKITRDGEVFGAYPYAITEERQQEFDFSEMILRNKTVFFYHKQYVTSPPTWRTLEDLRDYHIGGVLGFSYVAAFEKSGLTVDLDPSEERAFKKLEANRINLMITDEVVGWHLIQQLFPAARDRFATLDKPLETGNSHLMISRKYPNHEQLLNRFNQALQRIKDKGVYQTILVKYGIHEP